MHYMEIRLVSTENSDIIMVDGKNISNIGTDEKLQIIEKLKPIILESGNLNIFLQYILENLGEYITSDRPCSQCGDYIDTYTLEI